MDNHEKSISNYSFESIVNLLISKFALLFDDGVIFFRNFKNNNYSLKKEFSLPDSVSIHVDEDKIDGFDLEKIANYKYGKHVLHFIDIVKKNFDEDDLVYMINNFNNLSINNIRIIDFLIFKLWFKAYYDGQNNEIKTQLVNIEEYIFHELFHAASSNTINNVLHCGFAVMEHDCYLYGRGFNEGYTQYLTCRYFPRKKSNKVYPYFTKISEIVEDVIGKDLMQSLYISADSQGLYDELDYYISGFSSVKLLATLDEIYKYIYEYGVTKKVKENICKNLSEINCILVELIINKVIDEILEYDDLNINYIYEHAKPLLSKLPTKLKYNSGTLEFWDAEKTFETVKNRISYSLKYRVYYPQKK